MARDVTLKMWMVDPSEMCERHLFEEHTNIHIFNALLEAGEDLTAYIEAGVLDTGAMQSRHDQLVAEMIGRGMAHTTPFAPHPVGSVGEVDHHKARIDLADLCDKCFVRICQGSP